MIQSCARCGAPASAVMSFSYGDRSIWIEELTAAVHPGAEYALCTRHADQMSPPVGWALADRRERRPLFVPLEVA